MPADHWDPSPRLIDAHAASQQVAAQLAPHFPHIPITSFRTSQRARANAFEVVHAKDVVIIMDADSTMKIGSVLRLFDCNDFKWCIIQWWREVSESTRAWKLLVTEDYACVELRYIHTAVVWSGGGSDVRTVLKPLHAFAWATI